MLSTLQKYSSALGFILKFFVVYIVLTFAYSSFLSHYEGVPDAITKAVAYQSNAVISFFGYASTVVPHESEPTMKLLIEENYVGRIVEGCNGISVLILFITFVIAFTGNIKNTILFVVLGSALLYVVNIFRIVILGIGLYLYPSYEAILHQIVFPSIIYGMVFILWMIWVKRFSKK